MTMRDSQTYDMEEASTIGAHVIRKRDEDACIEDAFYYTCIQLYIYSWALTCTRHVDQKGAVYRTSHDSTGFSVSLVTPRERRACHVSSPISVILPHRRQLRRLFNGNRMDNGRRGWASIRLMRATRNEFLLLKIWNYVYDRLRPRNYIVFFWGGGIWKATCNNLIEKFCISMWYRDPKNWQKRSKDLERLA